MQESTHRIVMRAADCCHVPATGGPVRQSAHCSRAGEIRYRWFHVRNGRSPAGTVLRDERRPVRVAA